MAGFLRVGGIYARAIVKPRTSSFFPSKIIRFDNLAVSGNLNLPNTITGRIDNDFLLLCLSHGRSEIDERGESEECIGNGLFFSVEN